MKQYVKDHILDQIYPARCPVCGQRVPRMPGRPEQGKAAGPPAVWELICRPCFYQLPFLPEACCMICGRPLQDPLAAYCPACVNRQHVFAEARSLFSYRDAVQKSLYRLKYSGCREYARFYAAALAYYLGDWVSARGVTAIVPIPLHRTRRRERGYNQAEDIAVRLGTYLDLPVRTDILRRVRQTQPQKMLGREERLANLAGAFRCTGGLSQDDCLLLTDDILTTGATVDAAAEVLRGAGCGNVYVITVAVAG